MEVPVGEEAVYRIMSVVEHFEYGFQPRFCQQLDMGGLQFKDRQLATRLSQLRQSKDQCTKPCCIQFAQVAEVQCHTKLSCRDELVQFRSKIQILLPDSEISFQIKNLDALHG